MNKSKVRLIEVIDSWTSGDWGDAHPSRECNKNVFCIGSADIAPIYNNSFNVATTRYISERSYNKNQLHIGDIIVEKSGGTRTCSTGRVIYVNDDILKNNSPLICSNFCTAFKVKKEWDNLYIYYLLRYIHSQGVFMNFEGKTSGLHNLDINAAYRAIEIPDLDLKDQKRISTFLSNLDRKIALNRAINQNLEALAKQLYDYWFVQFDFPYEEGKPYKSSGGKMVWNEMLKREVPDGWEVKRLGDLLSKLSSGKRPKGGIDKSLNDGIPSLGAECIDELGVFDYPSTPYLPFSYRESIKSGIIEDKDILVYKDGEYVGKTTMYQDGFPFSFACVNEHVFLLHASDENIHEYLVFTLKKPTYFKLMQRLGRAKSGQPGLNRDDISSVPILVPEKEVLLMYKSKVENLLHLLFAHSLENATLIRQRDELLPLLMNGQVTIE